MAGNHVYVPSRPAGTPPLPSLLSFGQLCISLHLFVYSRCIIVFQSKSSFFSTKQSSFRVHTRWCRSTRWVDLPSAGPRLTRGSSTEFRLYMTIYAAYHKHPWKSCCGGGWGSLVCGYMRGSWGGARWRSRPRGGGSPGSGRYCCRRVRAAACRLAARPPPDFAAGTRPCQ